MKYLVILGLLFASNVSFGDMSSDISPQKNKNQVISCLEGTFKINGEEQSTDECINIDFRFISDTTMTVIDSSYEKDILVGFTYNKSWFGSNKNRTVECKLKDLKPGKKCNLNICDFCECC